MTFRTIAEFEAFTGEDAPTPAETALTAACRIRASLLRLTVQRILTFRFVE